MTGIPLSVIIVTKNEQARIGACLAALSRFDDLWVVDSGSTDRTMEIAAAAGAKLVDFQWNGRYPKKRQWCLDTLPLAHDFVFFIDADEIATPALVEEIAALDFTAAGYFVKGRYVFEGRLLRHGLCNNKLCLIDRRRMAFPVVNDLDLPGMGEIEGHYQPVLKEPFVVPSLRRDKKSDRASSKKEAYSQIKEHILHNAFQGAGQEKETQAGAFDLGDHWLERHARYAAWERGMNARKAWPDDPRLAKRIFKALPCQGFVAFVHSYILKRGFLDGAPGFRFALSRWQYYRMI